MTIRTNGSAAIQREGERAGTGSRTVLLDLPVGLVENLRHDRARYDRSPEDYCDVFQVCLPYRGIFVWHVGREDVVGDSNQVIFVRPGESYRMSSPAPGGYAELVITPQREVLREIGHTNGGDLAEHPLFRRRRWVASAGLQDFRARFLHWASASNGAEDLAAEELVLGLLRVALQTGGFRQTAVATTTDRLIRRTKEFLEAELSNRVLLADVGRAVGASPAYLTDLFRRVEGISLHQYLTRLRLARALVDLPHAGDLTTLALDVGFASHSHFSAAFRRMFGCTPSEFRHTTRKGLPPPPVGAARALDA